VEVVNLVGWRCPSPNSWLRLDFVAKTDALLDDLETKAVTPLGDAEASMAIIVTSTQEARARAPICGRRCVLLPLSN
jgi:hypothetical protein